jgi:hypothetical protein
LHDLSPSGIFRGAFKNKTMTLPILIGSIFFAFYFGYLVGQKGRRKERQQHALQLSELARETVQRDIKLAKLENMLEYAIEQNAQEKA